MKPQTHAEIVCRLKSVEGHVRGVIHMLEEDRACLSILQQIQAIQGSLKQIRLLMLSHYLDQRLQDIWGDDAGASQQALHDELLALLKQKD